MKKTITGIILAISMLAVSGCETTQNVVEMSENLLQTSTFPPITQEETSEAPETETVTETSAETETAQEQTTIPQISAGEVLQQGVNPLTGEVGYNAEAFGKRPVAIMVNNIYASLPQYGISKADIIYEVPVEGGITRLMAAFADYTNVPDVCSIRSCRYYYPLICLGMDAIYVHWGADKTIALDTLNRTGIDHIDGEYDRGLFYRDAERQQYYATEHTGYVKGDEMEWKIGDKGFRTELSQTYQRNMFVFTADENVPQEYDAPTITANFSADYFSTFEYDSESGKYKKYHSGNPHMDGRSNTQLEFENVFLFQTYVNPREDGYLMDVALGGGSGFYFSNGGGQFISWTKENENAPIRVYDAYGDELEVNAGKSYIGFIGEEKEIRF